MSWSERGLSFGSVAAAYERYRLGYSPEVVDLVRAHATRPIRTAVEIGAGTGKATRVFAAAGIAVTALEPDPEMLAEFAARPGGDVTPLLGTFEDTPLPRPVDLVYAAAALHWTDPETRWQRITGLLAPGGVVASFGGPCDLADDALRERIRLVREPYVAEDDIPSPDGTASTAPILWPGTEMLTEPLLTAVHQTVVERRVELSADDFVGYLSTVSAYLILDDDDRSEVLTRIRSVLPDRVRVSADLTVHLARRR